MNVVNIFFSTIHHAMTLQRTKLIEITSKSLDHLTTSTISGGSRRRAVIIIPPLTELGQNYCRDNREVNVLKHHRMSATEQQPSSTKKSVD